MARPSFDMAQVVAYASWCAQNKVAPSADAKKDFERSLASSDPKAPAGKRGRQKGAQTRAFIYDGSGNLLGQSDCDDVEAGRMGVAASAILAHGADKVAMISYSRGFVGSPRLVRAINPATGEILDVMLESRSVNAQTGETSVSEDDSAEAHAAE